MTRRTNFALFVNANAEWCKKSERAPFTLTLLLNNTARRATPQTHTHGRNLAVTVSTQARHWALLT